MLGNIKVLSIDMISVHRLPLTQEVIGDFDWSSKNERDSERPLGHLAVLHMHTVGSNKRRHAIIHPSIKRMRLCGSNGIPHVRLPQSPLITETALRVLRLKSSDVDPKQLASVIETSRLKNITELLVGDAGVDGHDTRRSQPQYSFDCRRLKQAMLKHTPQLEVFGWIDMGSDLNTSDSTPFGSFAGFPCLTTLALDIDRFIEPAPDDESTPVSPDFEATQRYLPTQLETLEIGEIQWLRLSDLHRNYFDDTQSQTRTFHLLQSYLNERSTKNVKRTRI
jgi:hypothetical protein